jgi:hypothetical protein
MKKAPNTIRSAAIAMTLALSLSASASAEEASLWLISNGINSGYYRVGDDACVKYKAHPGSSTVVDCYDKDDKPTGETRNEAMHYISQTEIQQMMVVSVQQAAEQEAKARQIAQEIARAQQVAQENRVQYRAQYQPLVIPDYTPPPFTAAPTQSYEQPRTYSHYYCRDAASNIVSCTQLGK